MAKQLLINVLLIHYSINHFRSEHNGLIVVGAYKILFPFSDRQCFVARALW